MASQGIRGEASLENEAGESHPQAGPQYQSPDGFGRGVPANQMETEAETDPIPPPRPSLGIMSPGSLGSLEHAGSTRPRDQGQTYAAFSIASLSGIFIWRQKSQLEYS